MNDLDVLSVLDISDHERCYRAASSRDARFDGMFIVAVRTTGIYCRPSCPAVTPKRSNVQFYRSSAAAQHGGFRACKRCRPDAAPGSPEWDLRTDLVGRAMRMIADGVIDRDGVDGLAGRLGYSTRHLNRVLTDELGAGPLALARAQRSQTARTLIETTDMAMTDIAFAAGFGSVRQFNDTIREVFAIAPGELRRKAANAKSSPPGTVLVRLPTRQPFAGEQLMEFFAARALPGVEHVADGVYSRSLDLPRGHGVVDVTLGIGCVHAQFQLADWRDLAPAVWRIRRLFDLDADPVAIDELLGADPTLAPLVAAVPGLRAAGSVDPLETAVKAVVGQQVSVAGARTVLGRVSVAIGEPLAIAHRHVSHLFPSAQRLASAEPSVFPMPKARAATVQRVAAAVLSGDVRFDAIRADVREQLLALRGIGPWTADYITMRALRDPDVFLDSDLVVKHALAAHDLNATHADRWRPWRTYAMHHLWRSEIPQLGEQPT
ncbi:MAG TPA: DNA-3-methyladenine glycosylase 2 family protein [Ilumatobacter sp.]|nr:DNA-3-methyladenine glycosylase 2 family protein [Ilumatobacter sp.]